MFIIDISTSDFNRLRTAYDELSEMLKNEKDLEEKDEYIKAQQVLKEAETELA